MTTTAILFIIAMTASVLFVMSAAVNVALIKHYHRLDKLYKEDNYDRHQDHTRGD